MTEAAPEGGTHETYYAYNLLGQLTTVTMPRGGHTQTRTFSYDLTTGRLLSATNPENGTVSYTYNADGTMATKTDAKAQRTEYSYDEHQRVSQVRYYAGGAEQTCERVDYTYADNGTLGQVTWGGAACSPGTLTEYFGYGTGGKLISTNVVVTSPDRTYGAFANFGWTNEGRLSTVDYPVRLVPNYETGGWLEYRDRYRHVYDVVGRPVGLKWQERRNGIFTPEADYVKDVSYGGAGELLSLKYLAAGPSMPKWYTETRTYNDRLQLTRMTAQPDYAPYPRVDLEYRYPAGQNAGRISQMKDWVTGEEISYQYDSLNRLISAVTTGPEWGLSFAYDGFGNLTNQTVTKGAGPSLAVAVDPATNRMVGQSYDANGNLQETGTVYDVANRRVPTASGFPVLAYDPFNRKVWTRNLSWGGGGTLHLYGPSGELLGDFAVYDTDPDSPPVGPAYVYFGGRRLLTEYGGGSAAATVTDRLGSGRVTHESLGCPGCGPTYQSNTYYPYGETRTGPGSLFATYTGKGNLRHAMNRWYSSQFGRFTTPDPYQASAGLANPQSWNRYAYVQNDPVNANDPTGLDPVFGITVTRYYDYVALTAAESAFFHDAYGNRRYWGGISLSGGAGGYSGTRAGGRFDQGKYDAEVRKANSDILKARIDRLGNCERILGGASTSSFLEATGEIAFYDGRPNSPGAGRSQQQIAGNGDPRSLATTVFYDVAATLTSGGEMLPHVVLGRDYYNDPSISKADVLLHEALHYALNMGDEALKNYLAQYGFKRTEMGSHDITEWLQKDCPK